MRSALAPKQPEFSGDLDLRDLDIVVHCGAGAYIASGSVITEDVPEDALAFGRARQKTLPGKGREIRAMREAAAAAAKK